MNQALIDELLEGARQRGLEGKLQAALGQEIWEDIQYTAVYHGVDRALDVLGFGQYVILVWNQRCGAIGKDGSRRLDKLGFVRSLCSSDDLVENQSVEEGLCQF